MPEEVSVNIRIDRYTNRLLGVIKEMFGLRDKGEALKKLAHMYGDEIVAIDANDAVCREIVESCNNHIKMYGFRKMSEKELDKLCDL